MTITYYYGQDNDIDYELELDTSDIFEFLLSLDTEDAEKFVKEYDETLLSDLDLHDALYEIALNDEDFIKEYYEDDIKEYFEDVAQEQINYIIGY